ncbi:hypothetical protein KBB96_14800 [Luteolibacter ambystomatis]|uniref:Uncharacterized protein n=1 Tax=Luteolibacter ambystomatis TaxID=2824561 RepID=A0A975IYD9_9BACT|nr:hypothetical protein [Luteolibacter ambystomatis]QUE50132.1 hypothetical protein KBB96_14800 [Luteolibacter ambystomatis]
MNRKPQLDATQWEKIAGHWPLVIPTFIAMAASWIGPLILKSGNIGLGFVLELMITSAALIGWAKFPAYRSGRIFSWGTKTVPASRAWAYRWGWLMFLSGMVLALLLISMMA